MLLSATVTGNKPKALMFNDFSRTSIHARTTSDIYVKLCEEDRTEGRDEHRCGKPIKSMYGTRAAAHDWQAEVTRTMKDLGSSRAKHPNACSGTGKETSKHSITEMTS